MKKNSKYSYIEKIKGCLDGDRRDMLMHIYEPQVVATPLSDSRRDVCIMPDGEIRSYGRLYGQRFPDNSGQAAYLASKDSGISWTLHYSHGIVNSCAYFEDEDIYISISDSFNNNLGMGKGLWALRSKIGPDDADPEIIQIASGYYIDSFTPQISEYGKRIWFTAHRQDWTEGQVPASYPCFFYSDDFGKSWTGVELASIEGHDVEFPHKGKRWCHASGGECHAIEVSANKMMMIIRTPKDCFYVSNSEDGGESWSYPEPSNLYGTNTTAFLLKISDGRILSFWNNTRPLPEQDHDAAIPPVSAEVKCGIYEDVFTNRDAAHVAISEDGGETFIGCRELYLNPLRNNADFRYIGGAKTSADKSVHQFQAFELPYNKILVSVGQNEVCRRLIIFDIDWLYQTEVCEDFVKNALEKISTQTYVKSGSGSQVWSIGNGHCAWNRAHAAYLVPDPAGSYGEVLSISSLDDDRLYNRIGGATWNFPASRSGKVSIDMMIEEKRAKIILTDRWYNPTDAYAAMQSPFFFELTRDDIGDGFCRVDIIYETDNGSATVYVGDRLIKSVAMSCPCPTGISYLVLQCDESESSKGFYVKMLEKKNTL